MQICLGSDKCPVLQGLDTHIKANVTHAFHYDSRQTKECKMEWFMRNHLVGGILNSNIREFCNAKLVIVGDEVFVVATKAVKSGSEVFVHYKVR